MSSKKHNKKPCITFTTAQSNFYRVVHADGVMASFGVHNTVRLIFFNQRPSDPAQFSNAIKEDGMMGEEIPETVASKSQWIRQLEVEVEISPEVAGNLMLLLQKGITVIHTTDKNENTVPNEGKT